MGRTSYVGVRGGTDVGLTTSNYNSDTNLIEDLKAIYVCEWPCYGWGTYDAALSDLDGDGKTEIIAPYSNWIYVFDTNETTGFLDWPQYLHDERHTGAYTASGEPVCIPGKENPELPGDLDCDCRVTVADIMMVAAIWNTEEGDEAFKPDFDFDDDGRISIVDIMYIAAKWNTHCP